jgi:acetyl esterase
MTLPRLLVAFLTLVVPAALQAQDCPAETNTKSNDALAFDGARAEVYKTIGDVSLKVHIFEPAGHKLADKTPAIVFFFGGGWKGGTPKQFEQHCRYLASRGLVAMTADYRVASRHKTTAKECVQDGKSAVRWVRTNAARLGVDPNRIAAGGGSAGGHVAACTAVLEGWEEPGESSAVSCVPNALVLFNPAMALAPFEGAPPTDTAKVGDLAARMGTDPINLSPTHHVRAGIPPTIQFFGTNDDLGIGAKLFHQHMLSAGNRSEFKLYDGHKHGFFNFGRNDNVQFALTLAEADRFLASLGYLTGEPRVEGWMKSR